MALLDLHEPATVAPWAPLAGVALLDQLRGDRRTRRSVEPAFATRVRGELSDRCGELLGGHDGAPIVLDRRSIALGRRDEGRGREVGLELLRSCCSRLCFGLGVLGEWSEAPFDDAVEILRTSPRRRDLVLAIDALTPDATAELRADVTRDVANLAARWPSLNPAWMPRTAVAMAADVDGGRVRLRGTADLVVGIPHPTLASLCLVSLRTAPLTAVHLAETRALALVETVRRGVPPFRIATYSTVTGELAAEDVSEALLTESLDLAVAAVAQAVEVPTCIA